MAASPDANGYRIDEVSRLAGTTVRNVRAYQDRGLLPPPKRVGRVGWYSDAHLARLRLIGEMLDRGYNLGNIAELIDRSERGQGLSDVLGREAAPAGPGRDGRSTTFTKEDLRERFAPLGCGHLDRAIEMGFISREGDHFGGAGPRLLEEATGLMDAGVPAEVMFETAARIAAAADLVADLYAEILTPHLVGGAANPMAPEGRMAPEEEPGLTEVVRRLRRFAADLVDASLVTALDRRIGVAVSAPPSQTGPGGESTTD
jgi:DNA-binding transcriptional MerR regulator